SPVWAGAARVNANVATRSTPARQNSGFAFSVQPISLPVSDAQQEPERRNAADAVGRQRIAPARQRRLRAPMRPYQREHNEHEGKLPELGANVEEQQRERQRRLWNPQRGQRGREAEPVQQPEGERHDPRTARGESDLAALQLHDLDADEDDAERDRG